MTAHEKSAPSATNAVALTFDIDWAPDWLIDEVSARVASANVRATWFATHKSPAIDRIAANPSFEVGLHPNFLPGSTQGGSHREVMTTLRAWFPDATAVRTHSLFQSERLLELMVDEFGVTVDCSIHLPQTTHVTPHASRYTPDGALLVRLPHIFQDNIFMLSGQTWQASPDWLQTSGLKVLNFHPVHVWLNARHSRTYEALKSRVPLSQWVRTDLAVPDAKVPGAGWFLDHCLDRLRGTESSTISQIARAWLSESTDNRIGNL